MSRLPKKRTVPYAIAEPMVAKGFGHREVAANRENLSDQEPGVEATRRGGKHARPDSTASQGLFECQPIHAYGIRLPRCSVRSLSASTAINAEKASYNRISWSHGSSGRAKAKLLVVIRPSIQSQVQRGTGTKERAREEDARCGFGHKHADTGEY